MAFAGRPTSSRRSRTRACRSSSADPVGDLTADRPAWVERGVRVLEDELEPDELARGAPGGRAGSPADLRSVTVPPAVLTRPTAARASVDLPHPDSPTRPTIRPRSTERLAPATARTLPPAAVVVDDDVVQLERAHAGRTDRRGTRGAGLRRARAAARPTGTRRSTIRAARVEGAAGRNPARASAARRRSRRDPAPSAPPDAGARRAVRACTGGVAAAARPRARRTRRRGPRRRSKRGRRSTRGRRGRG